MEYTNLGRSGLKVSRLCLGTMNFGPHTSVEDAHAIMDRALGAGLNFFDTANVYGRSAGLGFTEQTVGSWFGQGGGRRDKTVLATKVYGAMSDWPNDSLLSALSIRKQCEASLRRLQTDYIDLYQLHHVDLGTPWDEIWEAMDVLRTQGKILYAGSSNHDGWMIAKAQEAARRRSSTGLISEQHIYNLLERHIEIEVLPACADYGVGVIPWSPLQQGLLAGILRKESQGRRTAERTQQRLARFRPQIEQWEHLCAELGHEPADVGIAWLLHQPGVTAPIIGPRTVEQLDGALHALEIALDDKTLAGIDEIFPGPGPGPIDTFAGWGSGWKPA